MHQAARERAQATVDAAAANMQPSRAMMEGDQGLWVHVSPDRWKALEVIAQGRPPEEVVADLIDEHVRKNRIPF